MSLFCNIAKQAHKPKFKIMKMYWWIIALSVIAIGIFLYAGKNENKPIKRENFKDISDSRISKGKMSKEKYEELKRIINSK